MLHLPCSIPALCNFKYLENNNFYVKEREKSIYNLILFIELEIH
jgi:hypothetical protein